MHKDFICYSPLCDTPSVAVLKGKTLYHVVFSRWQMDANASVPEKIRFYRAKRGVTCYSLAEQAGLHCHTIFRYESGETEPSLEDLKKIAWVLGVEADKLYDDYYRFLDAPYPYAIRTMRKTRRMTQKEFGEQLGVTAGTVKRWESGQHGPPREVWKKLKKKKWV